MKKLLFGVFALLFCFSGKLDGQTYINTWYIIAPTSGCNGVWALDASDASTCVPVSNVMMNPWNCIMGATGTVNDTAYYQLCNFPCDFAWIVSPGDTCFGSTGQVLNVPNSSHHIVTTYPNPSSANKGWNVWLHESAIHVTVNIYNSLGQLVSVQSSDNTEHIFHVDTSTLCAGTYIVEISVNDATPCRQPLILTQ